MVTVTTMSFETTTHLNKNLLNSNFKLLYASKIRQISVIQKLQTNLVAQKK